MKKSYMKVNALVLVFSMLVVMFSGLTIAPTPAYAATTIDLQQGVNGYAGGLDQSGFNFTTGGERFYGAGQATEYYFRYGQGALIYFDLAGQIPEGAVIDSASLSIYHGSPYYDGGTISMYKILDPDNNGMWVEGSSDDIYACIGACSVRRAGSGQTILAPWTNTAGSTILDSSVLTGTIDATTSTGWKASSDLTSDVQGWVDGTAVNQGWFLQDGPGMNFQNTASDQNAVVENRPKLSITYHEVSAPTATPTPVELMGDVNGNGRITAVDALMALQSASGRKVLTTTQNFLADVNGDGFVTSADALYILKYASGKITSWPTPEPTATATPEPTATEVPVATNTPVPTATPVVPVVSSVSYYAGSTVLAIKFDSAIVTNNLTDYGLANILFYKGTATAGNELGSFAALYETHALWATVPQPAGFAYLSQDDFKTDFWESQGGANIAGDARLNAVDTIYIRMNYGGSNRIHNIISNSGSVFTFKFLAGAIKSTSGAFNAEQLVTVTRVAATPVPTATLAPTATPIPFVSALITDLVVNDTRANGTITGKTNNQLWSVQPNLQAGDAMYGDRPTTLIVTIPPSLAGSERIRTAMESRNYMTDPLASFKVTEGAYVYIVHADAITVKPAWLSDWTDTGMDLATGLVYSLYSKYFAAGSTVTLGINNPVSSLLADYSVIVVPGAAPTATPEPTATPVPTEIVPAINPLDVESFTSPISLSNGTTFGAGNKLTMRTSGTVTLDNSSLKYLYVNEVNGASAFSITSTNALPQQYKVSVDLGDITYLAPSPDPDWLYEQCLTFLGVTNSIQALGDIPAWKASRKFEASIDNYQADYSLYATYFDGLAGDNWHTYDPTTLSWTGRGGWTPLLTYSASTWYTFQLEKTATDYIFTLSNAISLEIIKAVSIPIASVKDPTLPDYLFIGDPFTDLTSGSMKIANLVIEDTYVAPTGTPTATNTPTTAPTATLAPTATPANLLNITAAYCNTGAGRLEITFAGAYVDGTSFADLTKIDVYKTDRADIGSETAFEKLGTLADYTTVGDHYVGGQEQIIVVSSTVIAIKAGANSGGAAKFSNMLGQGNPNIYFVFNSGAITGIGAASGVTSPVEWAAAARWGNSGAFGIGMPANFNLGISGFN